MQEHDLTAEQAACPCIAARFQGPSTSMELLAPVVLVVDPEVNQSGYMKLPPEDHDCDTFTQGKTASCVHCMGCKCCESSQFIKPFAVPKPSGCFVGMRMLSNGGLG
ncbi:unnamed protein product [Symbiodinium sp. CCMP2456]|nr:unnamed protein product [Symbiodinium sp. CCMP2456]